MIQVTARTTIQSAASCHNCIISESRKGSFTRKWCHCGCDAARTAAQLVAYEHHCFTVPSPICANKVSQEKEVTVNAAPLEMMSNWQTKAIYPSSPICVNKVSLDKEPDREFTAAWIMTKMTVRVGCLPDKKRICQQKKVLQRQPSLRAWRRLDRG